MVVRIRRLESSTTYRSNPSREQAGARERDRVEDKKDCVQPHLSGRTAALMHRLILGDEKAGKDGENNKHGYSPVTRLNAQDPGQA
jgi:hypothetical protein